MGAHDNNSTEAAEAPESTLADLTAWDFSAVSYDRRKLRMWSGLVLAGCVAVLGVAAWIVPSPAGVGVQSQFGLGTCGMLKVTGLPCPTCGMTTAFAHTVRGQLISAFWAQPTGLVLTLAIMMAALGASWTLATGRLLPVRIPILTPYRLLVALLVLLVGGWAFKMVVMLANRS